MKLRVDSELKYQVGEGSGEPLVFMPQIDWETFEEANIIDAY